MSRSAMRLAAGLGLFLALSAWRLADYFPTPPNPFSFELALDPGEAGRADPLIVTGRTGAGDFLSVEFLAAQTVRFQYDSWGTPGLQSAPYELAPGQRLHLRVTLPSLDHVHGRLSEPFRRVRLECNGSVLLDAESVHHARAPSDLFFGVNPLGGTACGPSLRGRIFGRNGRPLAGAIQRVSSWPERIADWMRHLPWQAASLAAFSAGVVLLGGTMRSLAGRRPRLRALAHRHRWALGTTAVSAGGFAWLVTLGSFNFNTAEVFGNFYDYQAASLLAGRLDVPEEAIGGEAFESRGKLYGYFGPTPALLRVPFVLTGFAFGHLSRAFMLAYFVASLLAAYLILREARRTLSAGTAGPGHADDPPSPFAVVVFLGGAGLGSTLLFLGSRAYIFHEAILGGAAFALWSVWCALRHLQHPAGRWWLGALLCGVLSLHTRPTTGLFALTVLGGVAVVIAWREGARHLRRLLLIGGLCAAGLFSLNALAWLKFRTFDAAPLRISRPYTDPGRLEKIGGRSLHLVNLPHNFDVYVLFPNLQFEPRFPWIYLGITRVRREFRAARMDLPDHTLGLPYAMPGLFALATLGALGAAVTCPAARGPLVALWAGVGPMALTLFAAVATAHRYTGDFCPFLIATAAFGLAALERAPPRLRRPLRALLAAATAAAIAIAFALTLHYQRATVWGVPEDARQEYQQFRTKIDRAFTRPSPQPGGAGTMIRAGKNSNSEFRNKSKLPRRET